MHSLSPATVELSSREFELARLVAAGYTNREIAAMLSIRVQTVKNHVRTIFRKLGVHNRVQLTLALVTKSPPGPGPAFAAATVARSQSA